MPLFSALGKGRSLKPTWSTYVLVSGQLVIHSECLFERKKEIFFLGVEKHLKEEGFRHLRKLEIDF